MKKVSTNPVVVDVIEIDNLQHHLERLEQLLVQIKKALTEYLERQRALFPRFFFIGDDDLLEIIGNAKDVSKIQRHFRKLFAGVTAVSMNEGDTAVVGCSSAEGETLELKTPVNVEGEKIHVWLTNLEKEVSVSLASLLAESTVKLTAMVRAL